MQWQATLIELTTCSIKLMVPLSYMLTYMYTYGEAVLLCVGSEGECP